MMFGGLLLGVILIAVLPKRQSAGSGVSPEAFTHFHHVPGFHPNLPAPGPSPKPKVTQGTPWVLIGIGLGLAIFFRKETSLVTLGGTFTTAGITALLGSVLT